MFQAVRSASRIICRASIFKVEFGFWPDYRTLLPRLQAMKPGLADWEIGNGQDMQLLLTEGAKRNLSKRERPIALDYLEAVG